MATWVLNKGWLQVTVCSFCNILFCRDAKTVVCSIQCQRVKVTHFSLSITRQLDTTRFLLQPVRQIAENKNKIYLEKKKKTDWIFNDLIKGYLWVLCIFFSRNMIDLLKSHRTTLVDDWAKFPDNLTGKGLIKGRRTVGW